MAIHTQMYLHNLALSFASQDYLYNMDNIHDSHHNSYNHLLFNFQTPPPPPPPPPPPQCLIQLQDLQNPSLSSYNYVTPTTATTSCTTAYFDQKPPLHNEIDTYIVSQNERLKVALQEETKKQMGEIWRHLQAKGMMITQQKKQEIEKAREKRRELEERMRKMEAEKQAWKRMAAENESMVISLNKALEQVKEESRCWNGVDDGESWCDENEKKREEIEMEFKCKVCKSEEASVLLLPCRHLCCCHSCHSSLHACPLCHSLKKASIQPLFS